MLATLAFHELDGVVVGMDEAVQGVDGVLQTTHDTQP